MLLALQVPSKTVGDRKYPHLTSEETEAHELTSYKTQFSSVSTPLRCGDPQAKTTDLGCSQESWGLPRSEQILPQPGGGGGGCFFRAMVDPGEGIPRSLSILFLETRNPGWGARAASGLQACGALFQAFSGS